MKHRIFLELLQAIRSPMQLLQDAGFTAVSLDAQTLLECDVDQAIDAGISLRGEFN